MEFLTISPYSPIENPKYSRPITGFFVGGVKGGDVKNTYDLYRNSPSAVEIFRVHPIQLFEPSSFITTCSIFADMYRADDVSSAILVIDSQMVSLDDMVEMLTHNDTFSKLDISETIKTIFIL